MAFPTKNSVLDDFPLSPPPKKAANFIFIVVSLSLRQDGSGLPKVPQNSAEPSGFCRQVLRNVSHSTKPVEERFCRTPKVLGESSRGNTMRGNRTESLWEEICLWEGLWEDLWKPLKNLWKPLKNLSKSPKTSENLSKSLKTSQNPLKNL